jgi:protease I
MVTLQGKTVAFLVAPEGVEQVELTDPWQAVVEAGGTPRLVSTQAGRVVDKVSAADYDALVLPGGVANPDALRQHADAVAFVRDFFEAGKPVAAICHAPWTLIEADVVRGRTLTSWPSLRTDLANAGAQWVDEQVHVCTGGPNALITSRNPDDLPAFGDALVTEFARTKN